MTALENNIDEAAVIYSEQLLYINMSKLTKKNLTLKCKSNI